MKKLIALGVSYVMIFGGLSAFAINSDKNNPIKEPSLHHISMVFKPPEPVKFNDDYVTLSCEGEEQYLMSPGKPLLPRVTKTHELPFGIRNVKVQFTHDFPQEISLSQQIVPSPVPVPLSPTPGYTPPPAKDEIVYSSTDMFPPAWYSFNVGCGLNEDNVHVTFVTVTIYPYRYSPAAGKLYVIENADVDITFDEPERTILSQKSQYDLVIIAPETFTDELQPLLEHKNSIGIKTMLQTTDDIYATYSGVDKPEQIKYFIKDAIETWDITYVLLVGGLKSLIYAKPKDDANQGSDGWYVPVRYSNLIFDEPGYLCDLYYADIYREGGIFENWDSNGNGIFAEWTQEDGPPEDIIDLYPDVAFGRLSCTNAREVQDIVSKIIQYETTAYDSDWFNRMLVVSGDGFLDQQDLNIQWDTNGLPNGEYIIYAQSYNNDGETGPADEIHITLDKTMESDITFNHDDHLNPALQNGYPAPPIAEIVSVSPGNVLGNTDVSYTPNDGEAYCNELFWWANVSYVNGVLTIRGKSYDPQPYGNITNIKVWIENDNGIAVFVAYRNNTETYYEGEWVTGEKSLHGRGGALYYMPEQIEHDIVWTSNGRFGNQNDVIEAFSRGHGFAFFSGHGSPGWWGDHFPGIPGNRRYAQVAGLLVSQVQPFFPFVSTPAFPMNKLSNTGKYPIVVVGGCHNSMFNVSLIPSILDIFFLIFLGKNIYMHTYGQVTPACWSWYIMALPDTGAIATMGDSGYGWGWEGKWCTLAAGDGWITSEFFRQYGEKGHDMLGTTYIQALTSYISTFKEFTLPECYWLPDLGWDSIDEKTVQQFILLGDPSLKIGGYPQ